MTTATHGLAGKVEEIVTRMNKIRSSKEEPRDITLRQFLAEEYELEPEHLYEELGLNPSRTTLQKLMEDRDNKWLLPELVLDGIRRGIGMAQREQMARMFEMMQRNSFAPVTSEASGGARWITPEVFTEAMMRGAVQSVFYPDLVMREITVGNLTVTMPYLNLSDAKLADSEEAATIEEGTVSYGSKDVTIKKKAKGIKVTYEAIKFNTLDLVSLYFEDVGRLLGYSLNGDAVLAIINGDQGDGSEAAAVIGVADNTKGIQYIDILRVWIRLSILGRTSTSIIGNETTGLKYLLLDEVLKTQFNGRVIAPTMLKTPLPTSQDLYISTKVPGQKMAFQDSNVSLVQLTAEPLMVESEKIVSKQLQGTFATIYTGFAKFQRNASVVLDGSLAYSATVDTSGGWPSWMSPFAD